VKDTELMEHEELEGSQHLGDKKQSIDRLKSGDLKLTSGTPLQPANLSFTQNSMLDIPPPPSQDDPTIASRRTELYNIKSL
jgi:hypothetical protein